MRRLSIRWLILGVAAASLVVPLILLLALRNFDSYLIRQTERELAAQGAIVASVYQDVWAAARGDVAGNPRDRVHLNNSFVPFSSGLFGEFEREPPVPEVLPERRLLPQEQQFAASLSRILKNAQVFNLSGVRVLAEDGCVVASSRAQLGTCFAELPEVRAALAGQKRTALRDRVSDEPAPSLASLSRRGETRVFLALPVWNEGDLIGAILLSRTAESGAEWLFKRRRVIFLATLLVLSLTTAVSIAFSWFITRPLSLMAKMLRESDEPGSSHLAEIPAPLEVHALAVALDQRARELQRKNRYVADFAANVSHELKTPLTSIRGAVELLQDAGEGMDPAQRRRFLDNIDAAAERTERLVTRLLYLARLESPRALDEADLVSVRDFLQAFERKYGSRVTVAVEGPPEGEGKPFEMSRAALEAVLGNLVENALRHRKIPRSGKPEPVSVCAKLPEAPEGLVHFTVRDDGAGISPENAGRVFERFFTTERDSGGTGLGLSIVRATAERRGGRARIVSDERGTVAEVWL